MLFKSALLTIVILTEFTQGTIPLTTIDGSLICHESYSVSEPRYVSYRESYRDVYSIFFKTRWRVNYKTVYDTVYKIRETCCSGYEKVGSFCLRICNAGYQLDPNTSLCEPICDPACQNGSCTSPNTCTCNNGYEKSTTQPNVCVPVCDRPCVNADCVAPDQCQCHTGYRKTEDDFSCEPQCNRGCFQGTCTAPDICTCDDGYQNSPLLDNYCIPVCHEACVDGICTAPDLCTCLYGYFQISSTTCAPLCDNGCPNGECIAPNVCRCNVGYVENPISSGVCEPVCTKPCVHGICTGPDTCRCDVGFKLNETEWNVCEPICSESAAGFVKLNDSSDGICIEGCHNGSCQHGDCQSDGYCQCYYGWSERTCDTPTMCVLILEGDAGFREVNETRHNDALFESPWNGPTCDDSCLENIDNETLCYNDTTQAIPRVACFLRPDSRCKFLDLNAASLLRNSAVIGASGAILVLILGSALGFVIFLKYKKKTNDLSVIINRDLMNNLLQEDSGHETHEETIN